MRPKKHETTEEEGLFRARSSHMKHELVQLAGKLDWDWLDGEIATATKAGPGLRLPARALRPEPLEEAPRREARASPRLETAALVRDTHALAP